MIVRNGLINYGQARLLAEATAASSPGASYEKQINHAGVRSMMLEEP